MKCVICGESNEKTVCSDCENKKRCKECNILKTDFYKYKNNKIYSTCIECFNKKVKCEFCNKEFNRTYLSKHIERCLIKRCIIKYNNFTNDNEHHNNENHNDIILITEKNNDNMNLNNDNNNMFNRTLIVGPSFCGKTHLLLNKLQLNRLDNPEQPIKIITRSPEQYSEAALLYNNLGETEELEVEEDLEDRTIQDFQNCCVVFDDML